MPPRNAPDRDVARSRILPVLMLVGLATGRGVLGLAGRAPGLLASVVGLGAGLPLVLEQLRGARRGLDRAFAAEGPEALLAALRLPSWTPHEKGWRSYFEAWAYTLYGRFDDARAALAAHDFGREPAILQAAKKSVEALLCYFDDRDYAAGREHARAAQALASSSRRRLGGKQATEAFAALILVGEVLAEEVVSEATLRQLADRSARLPKGPALIARWGLAAGHHRRRDTRAARAAIDGVRTEAPHCRPLVLLPPL